MAKWRNKLLAAREHKKQNDLSNAMGNNLLTRKGEMYDSHYKGKAGYSSLTKRWDNLYKKALDYYNNEAYKGFYDSYNGTRSAEGYVGNTGRWYDDLDKQRANANEGVNELLAEIDKYSRYYNEDAVKYLRGLITDRQKSYNDVMTDAGKFRDYWSQWASEEDYNTALWENDFVTTYNSGDYDAAEKLLEERAQKLYSGVRGIQDVFDVGASEEMKKLAEYYEAIEQVKVYNQQQTEQEAQRAEYTAYDVDAGQAEIDRLYEFVAREQEITDELNNVRNAINSARAKGQNVDSLLAQERSLNYELYRLSAEYRGDSSSEENSFIRNEELPTTGLSSGFEIDVGSGILEMGDLIDFGALLSKKEAEHNTAIRNRDNVLMSTEPLKDPEFATKSKYISSIDKSSDASGWLTWAVPKSYVGEIIGKGDMLHEYINGNNDFKTNIEAAWLQDFPSEDVASRLDQFHDQYGKYKALTEDEIALYNYYYNTEGKDGAQKYLESIAETLNARNAYEKYQTLYANSPTFVKQLSSIPTGLSQFGEGLAGIFAEGYTPQSEDQMLGAMVREDLADEGVLRWYNFKSGEWEDKFFGSSSAQMIYDIGSTTANMLPSILASAAIGMVSKTAGAAVGATLLGASAGGNAKVEMLNMGYSKDQANAYGLLIGASEAGLSYVMSGIPGLRGADGVVSGLATKIFSKIDNALAKVAIALGGVIDEGIEELVQTVLEDWFKEIATGVDFDDPTSDEILYSSLLGMLSAAGMNAPGTAVEIGTDIKAKRAEGAKFTSDPGALIDEALRLDPNDKYALSLKAKLESGKKVTQAELGKLSFNEMESTRNALAERDKAAKQTQKEEAEKKINAEKRLAGKIEDKNTRSELAQTVTKALTGESVSNTELRRVAQNQAALTLISKELGLKKDLKVGTATVSDIRNAISQRQSPTARLSSGNILSAFAAQFNMDESAERSLMVNYAADIKNDPNSKPVTPEEYAAVYGVVYGAGKKGMDISKDMDAFTKVLSETAVAQAYRAGQNAAKNSQNDLQNSTDSDTINTNAKETENGEGIHLRDSGERNRGANPQGQVSAVEGNARQNQGRRKGGAGPRDSEAASLSYDGEEVDAKWFGIKNGLESGKVRLFAKGSETASMKEAKKIAAKYGLNVIFFGGGNLKIASGQKIISARAYIQGNDVYIRADHSGFTSDQLMRHEAVHYMIAKGEINVADVRKLINERFTPEEIDAISKAYAIAYADTGLTSDEIWEEVICDSVAEMNVFEGIEGLESSAEMAADFLPDLREATLESRKEATGPPKQKNTAEGGGGKYSIETTETGIKYVKLDGNIFLKADGTEMSSVEAYNSLVGKKITLEDGDVITFIKKLPQKNIYKELFKKLPGYEEGIDVKAISEIINKNIVDVIAGSKAQIRDEAQRHNHIGIKNFDQREVYLFDGTQAYRLELCIANLSDGTKIAYVKRYIENASPDITMQIKKAETAGQTRLNQPSNSSISQKTDLSTVSSKKNSTNDGKASVDLFEKMDADYLSAVERGDMETAQRMVDEAANRAGYNRLFYHGAKKGGGFTEFKDWSYFTENKAYAERYTDREKSGSLYTTYVKLEKPFDTRKAADRRLFNEIRQEYGLSEIQASGLPDWTDGYDISDYVDENDLDYDGIILDEGGDMVNGKPVSRGESYVVRKSAQIKSADPVTYDDNGNVIPLSERFNPENADIRFSQDLFEDMNEGDVETDTEAIERELSPREQLAAMLESDDMSPAQKGMLTKYKNKLSEIEANEAEIAKMNDQLDELKKNGKGNTSRADVLRKKIRDLEKMNAVSESIILNLEATKHIKRLLERERKAAYAEGVLAGQMAQGKDTAPALRKTEEELASKKQSLAELRQKRKDDLDALAKRYQESIQNRTEGRRQTKLRNDIKRVVAELDHLLRHGNKKSNVKLGLQDAVAAALEAFDINAEKMERYARDMAKLDEKIVAATDPIEIEALKALREKKQRNSELLADKLADMKKAYEDIQNNADGENYPSYYRAEAKVIMDRISDVMSKVGNTPIGEMTSDQLKAVYDMYRVVLTTVRDANKAFIDGKLEDLTENASDMTAELQKIKKLPEERLKAGDSARGFVWNELTPYYAFKRIGSETLMRYYEELVRGQDIYARDLDEAKRFAENLRKKYKSGSWNRNKVVAFKDKDGKSFKLNLGQMMSIYAYSKREQALDHMERGGFFFNNKETFRTDKTGLLEFISSNESGYKIDAAALARIKSALTADQIAYVDAMQAYLTDMGAKGNEVSRQMWGIDIFNEKVYFPLKSKEDFIYQANTPAETSSLKNDGMTKETKPHASNPIVLESFDEVWANHVNKMSMYHGFVIPIDNLNKLINYGSWIDGDAQSISTMLEARFSSAVNDYLNTFIKDLNGAKAQNGGLLGIMSNWLTKFKKTAVAASLSVVVQQPTAILRATSEIDPKYFAHLPKTEKLNSKWERIQKYAPIAIIKDIGGFDAGSGRQITEWLNSDTRQGVNKAMNKLDDMTMYGAALGDRIGWGAIWTAVEREVQAKQKLQYGTEEFWQACGKRFTDVIVKTQVYDSTLSRSGFMRGKDGLLKMATAFMGEPTLSINMLADAFVQGKRGTMKKRQVARTVAAVYTATIAASVIKSIIYGLRDDDEDESFAEKYMQALGGSILNDVNPLSMLPIFRDVVSILEGWDVERTDMAIVQDLYNAITALDSENKTTWRKIEDLAGAVGALAGVPAKNLMRTAREIYNAINDTFDGIEGGDVGGAFIEGVTGKEKSKSQTLYDALIGGEKERIEALRKGYKTDEAYMSAVRTALREHDPRIKEAAKALNEGDLLTRNEIMLEILGEGVFDKKTVDKAIDAEAQALKNTENKDDTSKETDNGSIYVASDINVAFEFGSDELALDIITELTEIKVADKIAAAKAKAEAKGKSFDEDKAREEAEYEVAASLRSTMTGYWKPKYLEAYNANDRAEMNRIENILYTSGLYEYKSSKTLDDVLEEWVESDKE